MACTNSKVKTGFERSLRFVNETGRQIETQMQELYGRSYLFSYSDDQ